MPSNPNLTPRIVFCDFDGTITAVETFAGMIEELVPDIAAEIIPQLYARTLTLRQGVRQMLESVPCQRYGEAIAYARDKPIRAGFRELLDFLNSHSVPCIVVSGGLRDMVEAVLRREGLRDKVQGIAALDVDTRGEYWQVGSEFEGDTELVAKVKVMARYPALETVAIGDSITDVNMALAADVVFARDRLMEYLKVENKSYIPWEDFFEVRDCLASRWEI